MADTLLHPTPTASDRLCALGPDRRRAAYEEGGLTLAELHVWAAL